MRARAVFLSLLLVLLLPLPAFAQGPVQPQHSDLTWQASYWNNDALWGAPVLVRQELSIDHDWGDGSPKLGVVNADRFSARWTRHIDVMPGLYWFTVSSDDGVRLWIDDELVLDEWHDHATETYSVETYMGPGHHLVTVEYYENRGAAVIDLRWMRANTDAEHWRGEYFDNPLLSGSPALVREDVAIDFEWETGSPAPGDIGHDRFSVRWTGTFIFRPDTYLFTLTVDDGARLWVNGHLLIDAWRDQPPTTSAADIYLPEGPATIEMQYYEKMGGATARLFWLPVEDGEGPTAPETVVVDDTDSGFVRGGRPEDWRVSAEGYGGHLIWTTNDRQVDDASNWARWHPNLLRGYYEVSVFVPFRYTTTSRAQYEISHSDGVSVRVVDQSDSGARWVSLGTYWFTGTEGDYVRLSSVTGEARRTSLVAFDAAKWEPR